MEERLRNANPNYREDSFSTQITQDFVNTVINLENSGQFTPEVEQQLLQQYGENVAAAAAFESEYTRTNILTTSNSDEDVRTYANNFADINYQHQANILNISRTVGGNSTELLEQMSSEYKSWAFDLATLAVPQTISNKHLQLVQEYERLARSFEIFSVVESEPVVGLHAISFYETSSENIPLLYDDIANFIENSGIIFTNDESGIFWTNNF